MKLIKNKKEKKNIKQRIRQKPKNGYSLIELMMTIVIMGIMTAVVLVSLYGPKNKKSVEIEARNLAASVREAQNYAFSGKQEGSEIVCGWGLYYDSTTDVHDYALFYNKGNCSIATDYDVSYSVISASTSLQNKVKFNSGIKAVYFKIPRGNIFENGLGLTGAADYAEITVVSEADSAEKYSVCIYSSGMVKEKLGSGGC